MKKLIQIQFAATLVAGFCMGALGQTSDVSDEADPGQSRAVAPAASASDLPDPESMPPAAAAFVYYFRIQHALSNDLLTNVAVNAHALAAAVRKDTGGGFPAQLPAQAEALAKDAVTLPGARLDFAIISGQFMSYLKAEKPPVVLGGPINLLFDPVTRLYWLQTGDPVPSPYLGKTGRPISSYYR